MRERTGRRSRRSPGIRSGHFKTSLTGLSPVLAEIARYCSSTAQLLQVHSHGVGIIAGLGDEEQLRRYMPAVAEEGALFASCGSEASRSPDGKSSSRQALPGTTVGDSSNSWLWRTIAAGTGPHNGNFFFVAAPFSSPWYRPANRLARVEASVPAPTVKS